MITAHRPYHFRFTGAGSQPFHSRPRSVLCPTPPIHLSCGSHCSSLPSSPTPAWCPASRPQPPPPHRRPRPLRPPRRRRRYGVTPRLCTRLPVVSASVCPLPPFYVLPCVWRWVGGAVAADSAPAACLEAASSRPSVSPPVFRAAVCGTVHVTGPPLSFHAHEPHRVHEEAPLAA